MSTMILFGGRGSGVRRADVLGANALRLLVGGLPMLSRRVTGLRMSTIYEQFNVLLLSVTPHARTKAAATSVYSVSA